MCVFFVFVGQATAAQKYIPTPEQLRPAPEMSRPNLKGNANFMETDIKTDGSAQAGQAASDQGRQNDNSDGLVPALGSSKPRGSMVIFLWWAAGFLIMSLIGGWYWTKHIRPVAK